MPTRRFPPPWDIEEANAACFIVKDNNGHALAYVYFENEPGRRAAAKLLTRDEARRIALNIAKLPGAGRLLGSPVNSSLTVVAYPQAADRLGVLATLEMMDGNVGRFFRFARSRRRRDHDWLYRGRALMPGAKSSRAPH